MGNHNSGPKRRSDKLQLLHGVTRKDRLNPYEPKPPAGEAVPPVGMSTEALAIWQELAPVCQHMGTLTIADAEAFATLCELQATFRAASAAKDNRELFRLKVDPDDPQMVTVVIDQVLKVERETAHTMRAFYEY